VLTAGQREKVVVLESWRASAGKGSWSSAERYSQASRRWRQAKARHDATSSGNMKARWSRKAPNPITKSSFAGVFIALGGILVGLMLEGGKILQIIQPTAALIVFGGTLGAVMLQFPLRVVIAACKRLGSSSLIIQGPQTLINEIVSYADKARKDGIVSLDSELEKKNRGRVSRKKLNAGGRRDRAERSQDEELELDNQAEHEEHIPRVFESAGDFCPTIGTWSSVGIDFQ